MVLKIFPSPLSKSKAWAENFFLIYAVFWIGYFAVLIAFHLYEGASREMWIYLTLPMALICVVYPLLFPGKADRKIPILERYWVKANLWIGVFNFIGNYFWTHYFYEVLGCKYTMDTYRINNVPYIMFFATQAYFTFYHSLTNVLQRWIVKNTKGMTRTVARVLFVVAFSYFTAFMETFTIQRFPYYVHKDLYKMYVYGSCFYMLYFIVSFPMFFRIDENPKKKWTLCECFLDALAAGMLVTILLDFWRLYIGSIHSDTVSSVSWISQTSQQHGTY